MQLRNRLQLTPQGIVAGFIHGAVEDADENTAISDTHADRAQHGGGLCPSPGGRLSPRSGRLIPFPLTLFPVCSCRLLGFTRQPMLIRKRHGLPGLRVGRNQVLYTQRRHGDVEWHAEGGKGG